MPTTTQNLCYNCFARREDLNGPCPHCGFDLSENRQKFPVALPAGTVLNNRYIVGRVLGQGGFGITYVAFDTQLQAKVAVKEYMPNDISTRIGTTVSVAMETKANDFTYGAERFQEEARTLAKFIGHPNIAGVSSYFDENGTSYFVMDYIEGVSFKNYIANNGGKVSVDETLNVMIPVLRALTAVHAEGFIHRDVTPDNIYISKDGNVKLLDFGSARYSIGDKSKSLDVILKVGYAPKEQYIRRGRQGPFTDVYSCAACFYAALTGFLPPESLERLDRDELIPVSQAVPDIPEWLDRAILKGLAVQPEDRFQTAAEFLDAIENQLIVEVPAAGGAQPAQPERKKPKTALVAGIAAALAVCAGIGIFVGGRGGGTSGGEEGGENGRPSLAEALAPKVMIAGQEVSTADEFLRLENTTLREEDIAEIKKIGALKRISLNNVNLETNGLDWIAQFPQLTEFTCESTIIDDLDLTPFSGLTELTRLGLYGNNNGSGPAAKDLSPLSGLTKMTRLSLYVDYEVTNLDALAGMTELTELQVWTSSNNGRTGITDISGIAGMARLTTLHLNLGNVEDLSPLAGLTSLTDLNIYGDYMLEDLSFFRNMAQLQNLSVSGNGNKRVVDDLSALSGLTKLTSLQLNVPVASLHGLENLTALRTIRMYGGGSGDSGSTYTDVDALANLTELTELYLPYRSYNYDNPRPPIDLSGLINLTKLQELQVYDPMSLEPLRGLTELRTLRIQANNSDLPNLSLTPLSGMTKLTELDFTGRVQNGDLSPLSELTELRSLQVYHNSWNSSNYTNTYIRDLSPLSELTKLNSLRVGGTVEHIDTSPVAFVADLDIN